MKAAFHWIRNILKEETFTGVLLLVMASLALVLSNSPYTHIYHQAKEATSIWGFPLHHSIIYWVNHALMSFFFLQVGLEIKAEIKEGELNSVKKTMLPGIAALGGMCVPAIIFLGINYHAPHLWSAWSIPVATDIAFSLAVLQLFGKRISVAVKLFLLALAIFDDLGAVIVIAIFYTRDIHVLMLFVALALLGLLALLNYYRVNYLRYYLLLGLLLWFFVSKSGVDAAITGVFVAFFIPMEGEVSLLQQLYEKMHPWVTYIILPIFAFANAGVNFSYLTWHHLLSSLPVGIICGLVLGKPLGVFLFSFIAVKLNVAKLSSQLNWSKLFGVSLLCGIGFTMSLLLGELAFQHPEINILREIKAAVLIGSAISAILGYLWFYVITNYEKSK